MAVTQRSFIYKQWGACRLLAWGWTQEAILLGGKLPTELGKGRALALTPARHQHLQGRRLSGAEGSGSHT